MTKEEREKEMWETVRMGLSILLVGVVVVYGQFTSSEILAFASGIIFPLNRLFGDGKNANNKDSVSRYTAG